MTRGDPVAVSGCARVSAIVAPRRCGPITEQRAALLALRERYLARVQEATARAPGSPR